MNINRNNYENFFLLYADGELDAASMIEVEKFVAVHPDLTEELDMLMDTVLSRDPIIMPGKESLLRPELWNEESISSKQESLMLLLDNELEASETGKLQAEITADAGLQKEWNLLQQSRLEALPLEMPGKDILYRHETERKPVPVRTINRVKWLAAAAVIAGLGWFGLNRMDFGNNNGSNLAVNPAPVNKPRTKVTIPGPTSTEIVPANKINGEDLAKKESDVNYAPGQVIPVKSTPPKVVDKKLPEQTAPVEYASNNPAQKLVEIVPESSITSHTTASVNPNEITNPIIKTIQNTEAEPAIAQQAVYNEDDINDDGEYVNIAGARIKKQKLRGVFRNVTRTIGRTFDKSNVAQADMATLR